MVEVIVKKNLEEAPKNLRRREEGVKIGHTTYWL